MCPRGRGRCRRSTRAWLGTEVPNSPGDRISPILRRSRRIHLCHRRASDRIGQGGNGSSQLGFVGTPVPMWERMNLEGAVQRAPQLPARWLLARLARACRGACPGYNEPPPARSLPGFPDGLRGRRDEGGGISVGPVPVLRRARSPRGRLPGPRTRPRHARRASARSAGARRPSTRRGVPSESGAARGPTVRSAR
jgi:hypothetical protein